MAVAPYSAIYDGVLNAIVAQIQGLGLMFGSTVLPVGKLKLPKAEEVLEQVPCIAVAPHTKPEKVTLGSFENECFVEYRAIVALIAAGNRDFVSNLNTELGWRERVRRLFQAPPLLGAPKVWKLKVEPEVVLDLGMLNSNYDYSALCVVATTQEVRTTALVS